MTSLSIVAQLYIYLFHFTLHKPFLTSDKDYTVRPATNSMPVYIKNVKCSGKELSLLECGFRGNISENDHFNDVAVRCKKRENNEYTHSYMFVSITSNHKVYQCKSALFRKYRTKRYTVKM